MGPIYGACTPTRNVLAADTTELQSDSEPFGGWVRAVESEYNFETVPGLSGVYC